MSSRMTAKQAVQMLEDGTNQQWRVIPESQTRYYPHAGQQNAFFVLCLDNSCTGKIYVVPKVLKPHYSDYEKLLTFLRKNGLPILPKINMNMTNFPAQPYLVDAFKFYISGEIKATGSLSLKSIHSQNPLTYTPGKLANIKYARDKQIDKYLKAWNKISLIHDIENKELRLKVSNSLTNQSYDFDVAIEGTTFTSTITLTPSKSLIGGEWVIEGQISLKISGAIINKNSKLTAPSHNSVKVNESSFIFHHHTVYYYIGLGASAIGLGFFTAVTGGLDVPALASIAATSAVGAS